MRKTAFLTLTFSILFVSATASAADRLKPGLWSMTMKSDAMANAMKNMPKMSPEQMEQMKKMGLKMPEIQEGGMIVKVCITKEMTERDQPPHMAHKDSGCEMKNFSRNSDGYSMDMVCDGPNMSGTGKVVGKYASPESFNSTYDFTGTAHGHPMNTHNETSGKWLGSDCGDVKPASEMMKNAEMMKNK